MHKKVMVIDDVYFDRFIAKEMIQRAGFAEEVIGLESAPDALKHLMSASIQDLPEVIFLDIQMPDMDGFAFLERYEKLPGQITNHCQVVMLTSSVDPKDIKRAGEKKSVKHYITKPLDRQKLADLTMLV